VLNNTEKELNVLRDVIEGKTKETIELTMALKRAQNDIEELRTDGNSKSCQIDLLNTEAEKQRHAHHTDCDRMSIRIQHLENYEKRNTTELSRLKDYALALEKDLNTTESRNKFLETKTSKLAKDNKSMGMRLQS